MITNDMPQGAAKNTISLRMGHPDPATLLTPEMQTAVQSISAAALQYGPERGTTTLISYLVEKLNREQNLSIRPAQMMLVPGATGAVDMIARLFAGSGKIALIESPTYVDAIHVFQDHHIELYSIPTDEHGLIISALEETLKRLTAAGKTPAFLYTIPTFQNPSGATLPYDRRRQILQLAEAFGFLIVEDDVYRDLYFEAMPPASFYALSNQKNVLSIGSYSKILAPGLRLGWLVGSEDLIERCVNCGTTQMGGGASPFAAQVVTTYCCNGYLEPHVAQLRSVYKERRDVALSSLQRYMPDGVTWTQPQGGFFIWLTLPDEILAQEVQYQALQQNVTVAAGAGFFANPSDGDHNLRIAFSYAPLTDLENGIRILGQVIHSLKA